MLTHPFTISPPPPPNRSGIRTIGLWHACFGAVCALAVLTNFAIMFFTYIPVTNYTLTTQGYGPGDRAMAARVVLRSLGVSSETQMLLYAVLAEHAVIALGAVLARGASGAAGDVQDDQYRTMYYAIKQEESRR